MAIEALPSGMVIGENTARFNRGVLFPLKGQAVLAHITHMAFDKTTSSQTRIGNVRRSDNGVTIIRPTEGGPWSVLHAQEVRSSIGTTAVQLFEMEPSPETHETPDIPSPIPVAVHEKQPRLL